MIICPNCGHPELEGAIFCSECGAQLSGSGLTTHAIRQTDQMGNNVPVTAPYAEQAVGVQGAWISLHFLETGQVLPLLGREEFSLGRVAEGQPVMPDVDLSPFKAYEKGVSRLHLVLRRRGRDVVAMDLGSSNGTYLNGQRLPANIEQPLRHGDVLALGKLKVQVLLQMD